MTNWWLLPLGIVLGWALLIAVFYIVLWGVEE